MFEKLVGNLLSGYLSQYFKDIQIEQLKITVWNEEVLLENVELILEAFDYLQLPFALKQGRVGRLSIKIPWKKLGWDPIVIILEDIFISASQREDQEWSMDAVGKREFAGKKAKLAAAELAKLKKRVCDSQAGQSFISYITAKILDSIQVSVRNFHVMYTDVQSDPKLFQGHIMFGLKFSSLMIMKQIPTGTSSGRGRGGQVNIVVEIKGLELYSIMFQGKMELIPVPSAVNIGAGRSTTFAEKTYDSLLAPCDVSLLLLANRSGKLGEYAPQYSITAELTGLVLSLDEAQLHQLLFLWDYLCTSQLREKYGRYRPWCSSLSRKHVGWQILWWHYAQEAVLSDVRKKLRKTSWKYLGERLNFRRSYIKLYKTKLDFLRKEQQVPADTLEDLEQMEKESELDDILNYRSAAEYELQEILSRSSTLNMGTFDADISVDKSRIDEHSTGKSRGWLNWLSRGMLGAGGTDDSGQFSGVVSDEVIKDIYEATEFRPPASSNSVIVANDEIYLCAMKFSIHQISATLRSKKHDQEIAELMFNGATIESKLWKDWTTVSATVKSGKMVDPCSKKITMLTRTPIVEKNNLDNEEHSCSVHVDVSPNHDVELSIKGILQGIELTVDTDYISNLMEFFDVFKSFKFQQERVLLSLNEFGDVNTRLLSKAEYILSGHKKVMWDITIINVCINVPWRNTSSEKCKLVMESGSFTFMSKHYLESHSSHVEEQPYIVKNLLNSISSCGLYRDIKLEDLYHYVEINLNDFEIRVMDSDYSREFSILEKFCASITVAFCVIPDESILKQLEVFVIIQSIHAHFSPSIYSAVVEVVSHLGILQSKAESLMRDIPDPHDIMSNVPKASSFGFSISSNLESVSLQVDISNNEDNGNALMISLLELDIQYVLL
ncbi:putative Vacuolar protein sorting-associated protein [Quillaja saponaria]|uniref:Vacuolar protein sorting-associated protein n=1 Tax=Quillaja saponaria TaxID=32244 RepID=A0AAD7QAV3_QUISA|nr:putative Vacuolar protein sorting-associated protein [Quillaja saponaria]